MQEKIKKIIKNILIVFVIVQPILDTYWLYEKPIISIYGVGISTIIRFAVLGVLSILFLFSLKSKKQWMMYFSYAFLIIVYVIMHNYYMLNFSTLIDTLNFNSFSEIIYIFRMCFPIIIIAISSNVKINSLKLDRIINYIVIFTSGSIVITNLLKISFGAYVTKIINYNVFDWFGRVYDYANFYDLSTRAYFSFANMISALLFGLTILLLYRLFKDTSFKNISLLIVQMLAMFMLGTKVATMGFIISMVIMIIIYLFFAIIKKSQRFSLKPLIVCLSMTLLWIIIYPYSPCYNRINGTTKIIKESKYSEELNQKKLLSVEELIKNSDISEKNKIEYSFIIDNYKKFGVSEQLVIDKYPASNDPDFWMSVFHEPIQNRMDNRYIAEKLLKRIKEINNMKAQNDLFGISYDVMSKTAYLERDFLSHYYTLGIVGVILFLCPYLVIIVYLGITIIVDRNKFTFKNVSLLCCVSIGILSSYFCGNTLDSLTFTIVYSFFLGQIINNIFAKEKKVLNNKKVTIVALHLGLGGVEKFISSITRMLEEKYEVEIISSYKVSNKPGFKFSDNVKITYLINDRPYKNEFIDAVKKVDIKNIIRYGYRNFKILLVKRRREIAAIEKIDSKYVITTLFHNKIVGDILDTNYVKIATEHNYHCNNRHYINKVLLSVENTDYLVCVSEELENFYSKYTNNCKCVYIPNSLDYLPTISYKKCNNTLISVGRLNHVKGYLDLLDVISIVKNEIKNVHLKIIGEGEEKVLLENKIKELKLEKNVTLMGKLNHDDVNAEMQKSEMYVMSSYSESFALVLIEAMSNKLPCIAFDSANGAKTLLANDRGILIQNRDFKEMGNKIIYYLRNKNMLEKYEKAGYSYCKTFLNDNVKYMWYNLLEESNMRKNYSMRYYFDNIYKGTKESFYKKIYNDLKMNKKNFIITANPEAFMYGKNNGDMDKMLLDKNVTVVADGIGLVKAARMIGINIKERIPGIDISIELLKYANEMNKSVYFFGAKQEVLEKLKEKVNDTYPNIKIVGLQHGYTDEYDKVFEDILKKKPDIVLIALGMPKQEQLLYKYFDKFRKGILVGVGGSLDVISGSKKRAPKIFVKLNIEWLYRILKEPKRIKRFYNNNIKFIFEIKKNK